MMLERKIYSEMLKWKTSSNGKTALVIEGARRVGKSTTVKYFAQNEYEDYLVLDFAIESKDVKKLFIDDLHNLNVFFRNLLLLKNKSLPIKKSVIIFDEIELFPQARQAIKYLVQDGRYDYIETGSLISIKQNVKDILIPSEEYRLKMFPLDFEEFLWASGDKISVPAIFDSFNNRIPLGSAIHRKIMQNYRTYLAVGGMPSVVNAFVEGKTYSEIDLIKRSILELYEDD
ncbi:MAG: AAA family ATPase, partial [Candidatus Riflebacteria bacterium]|nr:AAA family ATPase [Candidatus Riflebacteria bacterium]